MRFCFAFQLFIICISLAAAPDRGKVDSLNRLLQTVHSDSDSISVLFQLDLAVDNPDTSTLYNEKILEILSRIENKGDHSVWPDFYTKRFKAWYNLGSIQRQQGNLSATIDHFLEAIKALKKLGKEKDVAAMIEHLGLVYLQIGDRIKALHYFEESLRLNETIENYAEISDGLNNIAYIYENQGDVPKALEYYHKSLAISESNDLKLEKATVLNNIAALYHDQKDIPKALDYFQKALQIQQKIGYKKGVAISLNNLGYIYMKHGKLDTAFGYFQRCLAISDSINDRSGIGNAYNNIGNIHQSQGNLTEALQYFNKALEIRESLNNKRGTAVTLAHIGNIYLLNGQINKALAFANRSYQLARELGSPENIKRASILLSDIHKASGNYKAAMDYYIIFEQMKDSIINTETEKKLARQEVKYEYEKKIQLQAMEQDKKDAIAKEALKRQTVYTYAGVGAFSLMLLLAFVLFRGYRNKMKANEIITRQKEEVEYQKTAVEQQKSIIEAKNKDITSSINYAKRIQEAILPVEAAIHEVFPESFILYRPKAIVSGDFYWFSRKKQEVLLAVADCTGHGVPGAFMSMIGNALLNQIVNENGITQPSKILGELRSGIINALKQTDSPEGAKDGMDICLVNLNLVTQQITFSGAYNPLYIVRRNTTGVNKDEAYELIEFKANRYPIGIHYKENMPPFDEHTTSLQNGDTLYLFSDGYADQFGGKLNKKLNYKRFKDLILKIQNKSMSLQKESLKSELKSWQGALDQVDDICVAGVRINDLSA